MRERVVGPGHNRARSLGHLAVEWIEALTVHGSGDVLGLPVVLDDELAGFVIDAYALDGRGRRLYDSAFLSRCKGRSKSELAGLLVLLEAMGPCRFAGWAEGGEVYDLHGFRYVYAKGEPLGRPVVSPFIRCLATEENQSSNVYGVAFHNLSEGPLSEGLPSDAAGLTRTFLPGGGEIRPSTSASASKDGGRETFATFDESHLFVLPDLRAMYATVRRNLAKRKTAEPWSLETSTMYRPGENSVAEATHRLASAITEGTSAVSRLLFDHREGQVEDLSDVDELRAALAEALGDFAVHVDLDRRIDEVLDLRNEVADSRRYFLNQASSASDAWIAEYEWAAAVDATKAVADRELITLGFDGSRSRARGVTDATALVGCRVSDGHLFEVGVWEQPAGAAAEAVWEAPRAVIDATVADAFRRWTVVGFYCDPARWETQVAAWEARYGARLQVRASQTHPCEWWMTGGRSSMTVRALEQFRTAVVDRTLSHSGTIFLTRHVLNARRRPSRSGIQIAKEHPDSPNKIDAAVAAVLAWEARIEAVARGVSIPKRQGIPRRIR